MCYDFYCDNFIAIILIKFLMKASLMNFAQFLTQSRKRAGLSQIDFAKAVQVSQPTVHHWEKGNRAPDTAKMHSIADILDIPIAELQSKLGSVDVAIETPKIANFPADIPEALPKSITPKDPPLSQELKTFEELHISPELRGARQVAFQGMLGAYSHQAVMDCFPNAKVRACESFERALAAAADKENLTDLAMIPIENSQFGRVSDIHQLLPDSSLYIVGEYFLPVKHMLLGTQDAELEDLRTAISHPQALGQTRNTLNTLGIKRERWPDTAAAAHEVATRNDKHLCAVASEVSASVYGLKILRRRIEDHLDNVTRFVIMSPRRIDPPRETTRSITSLFFSLRSIPAALYKGIGGFATQGVNILKLESYGHFIDHSRTSFYCEIEGNPRDSNVHQALDELEYYTSRSRILGVYAASPHRRQ